MRNVARAHIHTPHVMVLDIDVVASDALAQAYEEAMKNISANKDTFGPIKRIAVVIPCMYSVIDCILYIKMIRVSFPIIS